MCGIFSILSRNMNKNYNLKRVYESFQRLKHRGPDDHQTLQVNNNLFFGFHRLAINDLSPLGNQPMILDNKYYLIANGEIYNHDTLHKKYGFHPTSHSDCEIILHMYKEFGIERTVQELDGVFAFSLYDSEKDELFAARDPIGVRPLFIGYDNDEGVLLSSEAKGIVDFSQNGRCQQFPGGHYWSSSNPNKFTKWFELEDEKIKAYKTEDDALKMIYELLSEAVYKRLMSDRPIGAFLSGGLDSSLVTALIQKKTPINSYAIGLEGATDLEKAAIAAEYCKTNHHNVTFTMEEGIQCVEDLIYHLETYDITTVRASAGMYLLSHYIKQNSQDTVIYSGEGADEVCQGYLYFHRAPSPLEGAKDSARLINNLQYFDNLRCDRSTSAASLEVRVPFLDKTFVKHYMRIDPEIRSPTYKNVEKYLVRKAFDKYEPGLLPDSILWRTKEAFSDGVSSRKQSWYEILQNFIDKEISDSEFAAVQLDDVTYGKNKPYTKESLYYRKIYNKFYGTQDLIPYYWLPSWSNTKDPSARTIEGTYDKRVEDCGKAGSEDLKTN